MFKVNYKKIKKNQNNGNNTLKQWLKINKLY